MLLLRQIAQQSRLDLGARYLIQPQSFTDPEKIRFVTTLPLYVFGHLGLTSVFAISIMFTWDRNDGFLYYGLHGRL
jgi:hypothetical protein